MTPEIPTSRAQARHLSSRIEILKRNKEMYKLYDDGVLMKDIAEQYNLSQTRIHQIIDKYRRRKAHYVVEHLAQVN